MSLLEIEDLHVSVEDREILRGIADKGVGIVVSMLEGTLLIEDEKSHFRVTARDVNRMPYCGTFGVISGVLTVPKDKKDCVWEEKTSEEAGRLDSSAEDSK